MMNYKKSFLILACSFMLLQTHAQSKVTEISQLSDNHSLARITPHQRYLLVPIEEKEDYAALKVIVDNRIVKTFNAKIAVDHIDYFVPVALDSYQGKQGLCGLERTQNE